MVVSEETIFIVGNGEKKTDLCFHRRREIPRQKTFSPLPGATLNHDHDNADDDDADATVNHHGGSDDDDGVGGGDGGDGRDGRHEHILYEILWILDFEVQVNIEFEDEMINKNL